MIFAELVKNLRHKCLLSQEAFAKEIGVSFATVNRWETGKTKPTFSTRRKIDAVSVKQVATFFDSFLRKNFKC